MLGDNVMRYGDEISLFIQDETGQRLYMSKHPKFEPNHKDNILAACNYDSTAPLEFVDGMVFQISHHLVHRNGDPVKYGDKILLKNEISNVYIMWTREVCISINDEDTEASSFSFQVVLCHEDDIQNVLDQCKFLLKAPKYKGSCEGDDILYDDPMNLFASDSGCFNYCLTSDSFENPSLISVSLDKSQSFNSQHDWRAAKFRGHDKESNAQYLKSGDVIHLYYNAVSGQIDSLQVNINEKKSYLPPELALLSESKKAWGMWMIEKSRSNHQEGQPMSGSNVNLNETNHQEGQPMLGSNVNWKDIIHLKSLITELYLSISSCGKWCLSPSRTKQTEFQFYSPYKSTGNISYRKAMVYLRNVPTKKWLGFDVDIKSMKHNLQTRDYLQKQSLFELKEAKPEIIQSFFDVQGRVYIIRNFLLKVFSMTPASKSCDLGNMKIEDVPYGFLDPFVWNRSSSSSLKSSRKSVNGNLHGRKQSINSKSMSVIDLSQKQETPEDVKIHDIQIEGIAEDEETESKITPVLRQSSLTRQSSMDPKSIIRKRSGSIFHLQFKDDINDFVNHGTLIRNDLELCKDVLKFYGCKCTFSEKKIFERRGEPNKLYQTMLKDLGVIRLLVDMVHLLYHFWKSQKTSDETSTALDLLQEMAPYALANLQLCVWKNPDNQMYLAHLRILQNGEKSGVLSLMRNYYKEVSFCTKTQIKGQNIPSAGKRALKCVRNIYRDNNALLSEIKPEQLLDFFSVPEKLRSELPDFLAVFTFSNKNCAVSAQQFYMFEIILSDDLVVAGLTQVKDYFAFERDLIHANIERKNSTTDTHQSKSSENDLQKAKQALHQRNQTVTPQVTKTFGRADLFTISMENVKSPFVPIFQFSKTNPELLELVLPYTIPGTSGETHVVNAIEFLMEKDNKEVRNRVRTSLWLLRCLSLDNKHGAFLLRKRYPVKVLLKLLESELPNKFKRNVSELLDLFWVQWWFVIHDAIEHSKVCFKENAFLNTEHVIESLKGRMLPTSHADEKESWHLIKAFVDKQLSEKKENLLELKVWDENHHKYMEEHWNVVYMKGVIQMLAKMITAGFYSLTDSKDSISEIEQVRNKVEEVLHFAHVKPPSEAEKKKAKESERMQYLNACKKDLCNILHIILKLQAKDCFQKLLNDPNQTESTLRRFKNDFQQTTEYKNREILLKTKRIPLLFQVMLDENTLASASDLLLDLQKPVELVKNCFNSVIRVEYDNIINSEESSIEAKTFFSDVVTCAGALHLIAVKSTGLQLHWGVVHQLMNELLNCLNSRPEESASIKGGDIEQHKCNLRHVLHSLSIYQILEKLLVLSCGLLDQRASNKDIVNIEDEGNCFLSASNQHLLEICEQCFKLFKFSCIEGSKDAQLATPMIIDLLVRFLTKQLPENVILKQETLSNCLEVLLLFARTKSDEFKPVHINILVNYFHLQIDPERKSNMDISVSNVLHIFHLLIQPSVYSATNRSVQVLIFEELRNQSMERIQTVLDNLLTEISENKSSEVTKDHIGLQLVGFLSLCARGNVYITEASLALLLEEKKLAKVLRSSDLNHSIMSAFTQFYLEVQLVTAKSQLGEFQKFNIEEFHEHFKNFFVVMNKHTKKLLNELDQNSQENKDSAQPDPLFEYVVDDVVPFIRYFIEVYRSKIKDFCNKKFCDDMESLSVLFKNIRKLVKKYKHKLECASTGFDNYRWRDIRVRLYQIRKCLDLALQYDLLSPLPDFDKPLDMYIQPQSTSPVKELCCMIQQPRDEDMKEVENSAVDQVFQYLFELAASSAEEKSSSIGGSHQTDAHHKSVNQDIKGLDFVELVTIVSKSSDEIAGNLEESKVLLFKAITSFLSQGWDTYPKQNDLRVKLLNLFVKKLLDSPNSETILTKPDDLGLTQLVVKVISDSYYVEQKAVQQALELGIKLVDGGKEAVQKSFLKQFSSLTGRQLLVVIKHIVRRFAVSVQNCQADTSSFYLRYDPEGKELFLLTKTVFSFLKECCEGHCEELQKFFREQDGPSTSINLLIECHDAVKELLAYIVKKHKIDPGLKHIWVEGLLFSKLSLRMFTEFMQGPNLPNQLCLASSSPEAHIPLVEWLTLLHEFLQPTCELPNHDHDHSRRKCIACDDHPSDNVRCVNGHSVCHNLDKEKPFVKVKCPIAWYALGKNGEIPEEQRSEKKGEAEQPVEEDNQNNQIKEDKEINCLECLLLECETSLFQFLISLLEGQKESVVLLNIMEAFDKPDFLIQILEFNADLAKSAPTFQHRELASLVYELIFRLSGIKEPRAVSWREKLQKWQDNHSSYAHMFLHVEILNRDKELERVFFPVPTIYAQFSDNTPEYISAIQKYIFQTCAMEPSYEERLRKLLELSDYYALAARHHHDLITKKAWYNLLSSHEWWKVALFCACLVNLIALFTFRYEDSYFDYEGGDNPPHPDRLSETIKWMIYVISGTHILSATLMILEYVATAGVLNIHRVINTHGVRVKPHQTGWLKRDEVLNIKDKQAVAINYWELKTYKAVLQDPLMINFGLYYIFSILAAFESPLFFVYHMFDVSRHSDVMKFVLKATMSSAEQILATLMFGVLIIYAFAAFSFTYLQGSWGRYNFGDDDDRTFDCDTLFNCLQKHLDLGFDHKPVWYNGEEIPMFSALYGMTFFLLVNVIMVSLITGIIIDTFGEMRRDAEELAIKFKNKCFICDQQFDDILKYNEEMTIAKQSLKHMQVEHNLWSYIFLKEHILQKVKHFPSELTGLESYLYEQFNARSISFLPYQTHIEEIR